MAANTNNSNPIAVNRQGIKISKELDTETFDQGMAVRLFLESTHHEPTHIRIVDQFPEGITKDKIGFLPDYYKEAWEIHDEKYALFDFVLEPDNPIETLYVIREYESHDLDDYRTKPQVIEAEPDADATESAEEDADSEGTSDEAADEENTDEDAPDDEPEEDTSWFGGMEAPENTDATTDEDDSSPEDVEDDAVAAPPADDPEPPSESEQSETPDTNEMDNDTPDKTAVTETESVAAALRDEIENDAVDDDSLEAIATALDTHRQKDGSTTARLEHLETRVSELDAYSGAMEDFLNELGTAEDFRQELDDIHNTVESLKANLETLEETVEDATIEELSEELERLSDEMDVLLAWRDAMTSALDHADN